jgi:hypothetical protein
MTPLDDGDVEDERMSNDNPGSGPADGQASTTRVGTAEREAALARLGEHWQAGRLDPAEHESRVTRAKAAVTKADLDVLFADLPHTSPTPSATDGVSATAGASASGNREFLDGKRQTIMALAPPVAVLLFFTTHTWVWFLMIPILGVVLYGPGGRSRQGRSEERNRARGRRR